MPVMDRNNKRQSNRQHQGYETNGLAASTTGLTFQQQQAANFQPANGNNNINNPYGEKVTYKSLAQRKNAQQEIKAASYHQQNLASSGSRLQSIGKQQQMYQQVQLQQQQQYVGSLSSPVGDVAMNEEWADEYERWGHLFQAGNQEDEDFLVNSSDHSFHFNQQDQDFIEYGSSSPQKNRTLSQQDIQTIKSLLPRAPRQNSIGRSGKVQKENIDNSNIPRPSTFMKPSTSSESTSQGARSSSSSSRGQSGNSFTNSIQRWQLRTQNVLFSGVSGRTPTSSMRSTDSPVPSASVDNSITSEIQDIDQQSDASSEGSSKYTPAHRPQSAGSSVSIDDFIAGDENARTRAGSRTPSEVSFEFQRAPSATEEETSVARESIFDIGPQKETQKVIKKRRWISARGIGATMCVVLCLLIGLMPRYLDLSSFMNNNYEHNLTHGTFFLHGYSSQMRWVKNTLGHVMEAMDSHWPVIEPTTTNSVYIHYNNNNNNKNDVRTVSPPSYQQVQEMHVHHYQSARNEDREKYSSLSVSQKQSIRQAETGPSSSSSSVKQQQQPAASEQDDVVISSESSRQSSEQYTTSPLIDSERDSDAHIATLQPEREAIQADTLSKAQQRQQHNTLQKQQQRQSSKEQSGFATPTHHRQSWSSPFASVKNNRLQQPAQSSAKSQGIFGSAIIPWLISFVISVAIVIAANKYISELGDWIVEQALQLGIEREENVANSKRAYLNKSYSNDLSASFDEDHAEDFKSYISLPQTYDSQTFLSARRSQSLRKYSLDLDNHSLSEELSDTASTPRRRSKRILKNRRP